MKTEFFLHIKPPTITHQEKQVKIIKGKNKDKDKPIFYEPDDLKAARAKLQAHLSKYIPAEKYTGALQVVTKWCFPINDKHYDGEWKKTKPDTHNMNKLLFDVMTDLGYWTDDTIVASEIIQKFWATHPGIYISIEELGP